MIFHKGDRVQLTDRARARGRAPAETGTVHSSPNPTAMNVRVLWDTYGSRDGLYCARGLLQSAPGALVVTTEIMELTRTQREQLAYLLQSTDWTVRPPHERVFAESLYDDITAFEESVQMASQHLTNKFARVVHMLLAAESNRA